MSISEDKAGFVLKKISHDGETVLYSGTLYYAQHHMTQEIIKYKKGRQFTMLNHLPGVKCEFLASGFFGKQKKIKLIIEE